MCECAFRCINVIDSQFAVRQESNSSKIGDEFYLGMSATIYVCPPLLIYKKNYQSFGDIYIYVLLERLKKTSTTINCKSTVNIQRKCHHFIHFKVFNSCSSFSRSSEISGCFSAPLPDADFL